MRSVIELQVRKVGAAGKGGTNRGLKLSEKVVIERERTFPKLERE